MRMGANGKRREKGGGKGEKKGDVRFLRVAWRHRRGGLLLAMIMFANECCVKSVWKSHSNAVQGEVMSKRIIVSF